MVLFSGIFKQIINGKNFGLSETKDFTDFRAMLEHKITRTKMEPFELIGAVGFKVLKIIVGIEVF